MTSRLEEALGWARKYSIFQYPFVTACCGMEYMATACSHYDVDRFGAAHLTEDDPVRPHTQGVLHQIAHGDLALAFQVRRPGLEANHVGLLQLQLRCVFDRDDTLTFVKNFLGL